MVMHVDWDGKGIPQELKDWMSTPPLIVIAEEIARKPLYVWDGLAFVWRCCYCQTPYDHDNLRPINDPETHTKSCAWRRIRERLTKLATTPRPPMRGNPLRFVIRRGTQVYFVRTRSGTHVMANPTEASLSRLSAAMPVAVARGAGIYHVPSGWVLDVTLQAQHSIQDILADLIQDVMRVVYRMGVGPYRQAEVEKALLELVTAVGSARKRREDI